MSLGPVPPQIIQDLQAASTAAVANALLRRGLVNVYLQDVRPVAVDQRPLVGYAFTLRFIPAREDKDSMANYARPDNVHRRAIEECPPGAALVIDSGGCVRASSAGDLMAARLVARGAAGLVTDGGFRDTAGIVATGLPAFQRRAAPPATPIALHPVELNVPIGCGGVAIYPGDIIFGDSDGVVVIPPALAPEVAGEAAAAARYEIFASQQILAGRSLFGLFPPTPESEVEYRDWLRRTGPPSP